MQIKTLKPQLTCKYFCKRMFLLFTFGEALTRYQFTLELNNLFF